MMAAPVLRDGVERDVATALDLENSTTSVQVSTTVTNLRAGRSRLRHRPRVGRGLSLDDEEIDAIVAFLGTLTDRRR
jgi:hypothetical protein